jgi:AP-4 complex subunit epsilon-1
VASAPPSTIESRSPRTRSPPSLDASPQRPRSANKLRYAAYELPKKVGRIRRPSGSRWSNSSRSTTFSDAGHELDRVSLRVSVMKGKTDSHRSKTVTAGDLALATGDIQLQLMNDVKSFVCSSSSMRRLRYVGRLLLKLMIIPMFYLVM